MTAWSTIQSFRFIACMVLFASTFSASVAAAGEDRGTTGVCCLLGQCLDDTAHDTLAECEEDGGFFIADADCQVEPCPVCPFDSSVNCQQVQTIFGAVPYMDRNPVNGLDGETATVLADDVKFGGVVDEICWNTGFYQTPCCATSCAQNIDDTWEIRIYETDVDCPAIPGAQVGMSTIAVLGKLEGTGAGTGTWRYSGLLNTPIELPSGGLAGDTYWFEVSGYGDPGCEVHAIWSRDDGNEHHAVSTWTAPEPATHAYSSDQIGSVDVGFCENSGILTPDTVLGACCNCPLNCQDDVSQRDCSLVGGVWKTCENCGANPCPEVPLNDDCASAFLITSIPTDGSELLIEGENICATDDGPALNDGCSGFVYGAYYFASDIWYQYVVEACGELTVHSCNEANFDQIIAVYDARNGCPLADNDEIACGDDTCGVGAGPSSVTILVYKGDDLLIRVGGLGGCGGGFCGNPVGTFNLHLSFDENCPPCVSPTAPAPPHDWRKNRYISITPNPCDTPLGEGHIKITLVNTLVNSVTAVGSSWWATAPGANCISIVSSTRPATPLDWSACPTLHLTGCPIIPTSTYHIVTVSGGFVSDPPLVAETQRQPADNKWWGDAVGHFTGPEGTPPNMWTAPQGVTNFDDVTACLKTFLDPNAINATHVSITDIHPNRPDLGGLSIHPNKLVNGNDIFHFIQAFQSAEYPGPRIELCP